MSVLWDDDHAPTVREIEGEAFGQMAIFYALRLAQRDTSDVLARLAALKVECEAAELREREERDG